MKKTQHSEVLNYLQKNKKGLTSMEAFDKFGATRLSAIIFNLRKDGYNIIAEEKKVKTRYGLTTSVANYKLVS